VKEQPNWGHQLRKRKGKNEGRRGTGKKRDETRMKAAEWARQVTRGSHSLSAATAPQSTQEKRKKRRKGRDETLLFAVDDAIGVATRAEGRGRREKEMD